MYIPARALDCAILAIYICTHALYGPVRNVFDAGRYITRASVLRHSFYTCKYSHGARAWQGFVAIMSM
jgi:hypothetical protein